MPGADQEDKSSAEEGELTTADTNDPDPDVSIYQIAPTGDGEAVTAVSTWPPPAPPKLVIPKLSAPTNPVVELSSDSEDEISRKRRRRSRSRSRSRSRRDRSRDRHRRRRSRSRHKKSRRKRRHSSDRNSDRRRRRRNRRHSTSDSESDSDKHRRGRRRSDKSDSDCDNKKTSEPSEQQIQAKPMIGEIVKPTVNKMTEDLRAKVRAMLESK